MKPNQFDVIIIGSGIGGLTSAAILSKAGKKKVLVVEQHWKLGGLTHEFMRKGKFSWDVGLHYVSRMEPGSLPKNIFDFITEKKLKWNSLPHEFEKFIYPDFTFTVPSNELEYTNKLCQQFPNEAKSIKNYFKDMKKATDWARLKITSEMVPGVISFFINLWNLKNEKMAVSTTKSYLDANFKDEKLKSLLVTHWGDYGLPPGQSAFVMHSLVTVNYLEGAIYPEGGASQIAKTIEPVIEANGGKCLVSCEAKRLIVENGNITGIEVQYKKANMCTEIFKAPIIISDTGALHSYTHLIKGFIPNHYADQLAQLPAGMSALTLYVGFKANPKDLGAKGQNIWIFENYNHDESWQNSFGALNGKPTGCYLSFPSLKNTEAKAHTAEIISFTKFESFQKWAGTRWQDRGEEYEQLKNTISEGLLNLVEKNLPGFKDLVEYTELSTPLTYVDLAAKDHGEFYGLAASPERYKLKWLGVKTPLKNFYLTGSDAMSLGILGALMGGMATASCVLNPGGYYKIKKTIDSYS
jgi:phytoene dehydrogenase-like protein